MTLPEQAGRRVRLRSFVLGGILGASAVVAGVRRARRRRAAREPSGLAAFEDAPCFREVAGNDRGDDA